MQHDVRITTLADRLAAVLPEPPRADAMDYLAWRELVWGTAARLGAIAGQALCSGSASAEGKVAWDAPVDGKALLRLAATLTADPSPVLAPRAAPARACSATTSRGSVAHRGWAPTRSR